MTIKQEVHILTYHCAYNVGAVLQCYALSRKCRDLGYKTDVIDFRPKKIRNHGIEDYSKPSFFFTVKKALYFSARFCYWLLKNHGKNRNVFKPFYGDTAYEYAKFIKKWIPLSNQCFYSANDLRKYAESIDTFIVGSDQVWNPILSGDASSYLLDFVEKGRKNSYAASFGSIKVIDKEYEELLNNKLSLFNRITVREKSAESYLVDNLELEAKQVLDPVFLLSAIEWKKLIHKPKVKSPFIFVYRTEKNGKIEEEINRLRKENYKLKVVVFDAFDIAVSDSLRILKGGPIEFLSYLFGAEYVVTNSFHGMAFGLIAKKPSIVISHSIYNERIDSVMGIIGIPCIDGVYNALTYDDELLKKAAKKSEEELKIILS